MNGISSLIIFSIIFAFGPPVFFLLDAWVRRKDNDNKSKMLVILAMAWLIIGGGMCLSIINA